MSSFIEKRMQVIRAVGIVLAGALLSNCILAQKSGTSSADVNKANNPLTPAITVNFQDQAEPVLYDLNQGANAFLFRGVLPHKLGGIPQILRYTLPIVTTPNGTGGSTTGLGDLNLFDLAIIPIPKAHSVLGLGPQFTLPTATETVTGAGKWQIGAAGIVVPRINGDWALCC